MRIVAGSFVVLLALAANAADLVTLAGSTARVMPEMGGTVSFPATFAETTAVDVVDVTFEGMSVSTHRFAAQIENAFLVITVSPASGYAAGTYTVVVRAQASDAVQLVPVTLTRPATELRFSSPSPLRVTRTVYWPSLAVMRPPFVTLNAVGKQGTTMLAQTDWFADLRSSDGMPAGRLRLYTPGRIGPGENVAARIRVVDDPPLGTATGTLRIAAPQLANGALEQPVEVSSRLTPLWLLALIALGIAAGHYIRNVLEKRRLRADALLAATEARAGLQALIGNTPESQDAAAVGKILSVLDGVLADARRTPDEIRAAVAAADKDSAAVVAAANEGRSAAAARIAELRGVLRMTEGHAPEVMAAIDALLRRLAAEEQALSEGKWRAVAQALQKLELDAETKLDTVLRTWAAEVRSAIDHLGPWPEVLGLAAAAAEARARTAGVEKGELRARVQEARSLSISLRADVFGVGRREAAGNASRALDLIPGTAAAALIAAARARVKTVEEWSGDTGAEQLRHLAAEIEALRDALRKAIRAALKSSDPVPAALGEEKWLAAAAAIPKPVPETALKRDRTGSPEPPPPLSAAAAAQFVPTTQALPISAVVHLATAGSAVADQRLTFRLGSAVHNALSRIRKVTWVVDGAVAASGTTLLLTLVPSRPELLVVNADLEWDDRTRETATASVQIRPRLLTPDQLIAISRTAAWTQTAAAGILIAAAGLLIFRASFIGTLNDLVVAFLWGFSTDVGLARIRELSQPLLNKTIGT